MRRALLACMVGGMVLGSAALAPAAGASTDHRSTTCAIHATLNFKPGLNEGQNNNQFFSLHIRLSQCAGGGVSSATGKGGAEGELVCEDGVVTGSAALKAAFDWDTGDRSAINAFINFNRSTIRRGKVVFGLFLNESVGAAFSLRPLTGDCSSTPLLRSRLTGTISL